MANPIDKSLRYYAPDRAAWRQWLHENHKSSTGIWLVYYKKDSGKTRVPYADAVEEALCFGWIDSTVNPIDEHCYMQLFTPRKPKSEWSKLNKERVEKLTAAGLMTPAGQACIDIAMANGSWSKIDHVESFAIPADLEAAFEANATMRQFFEGLSNTNRKYMLHYLNGAKLAPTRTKRLNEILEGLSQNRIPDRWNVTKSRMKKDGGGE